MHYVPHTDDERRAMLQTIGVPGLEALFDGVPAPLRFPALRLPEPCSELELAGELGALAERNLTVAADACFLGAGAYRHYIPATVDYVLQRGELQTSYTPYQPELSQGMLQAMFEYQSMVCRLTEMEVSNASHYDGATSLAEGVLLALDNAAGERRKVLLSPGLHPAYQEVVATYLQGTEAVARVCHTGGEGEPDGDTAAVVVQQPDFYGQLVPTEGLAERVHRAGALLIAVVDPISLGLLEPPGAWGADVVVAEGQPFGIPLSFGGPYLGIFATRREHIRRLAGRLVGQTVDAAGARGYVLTLATREQHIRRAKATSNICTNAALCALAASVWLATLGKSGLARIARLCFDKSHYAASRISETLGLQVNPQAPERPFFKEFVVRVPRPVAQINEVLLERFQILGGYDLGRVDGEGSHDMLVAVTEMNTRAAIDRLVRGLAEALR